MDDNHLKLYLFLQALSIGVIVTVGFVFFSKKYIEYLVDDIRKEADKNKSNKKSASRF